LSTLVIRKLLSSADQGNAKTQSLRRVLYQPEQIGFAEAGLTASKAKGRFQRDGLCRSRAIRLDLGKQDRPIANPDKLPTTSLIRSRQFAG